MAGEQAGPDREEAGDEEFFLQEWKRAHPVFSERDSVRFLEILENDVVPTPHLDRAIKRYRKMTGT